MDSYENGVFCGRFYNPYVKEGQQFHSLVDFLLKMEKTLDEIHFPQSFTAVRNFAPRPEFQQNRPPEPERQVGKAATFMLRVLFRQNASWQGSLLWTEGRQEQSFRSVLELILLMDNALTAGKG